MLNGYLIRKKIIATVTFALFIFSQPLCAIIENVAIEKVIGSETGAIKTISPHDHFLLSEAYITRGESYLLLERDEEALDDLRL